MKTETSYYQQKSRPHKEQKLEPLVLISTQRILSLNNAESISSLRSHWKVNQQFPVNFGDTHDATYKHDFTKTEGWLFFSSQFSEKLFFNFGSLKRLCFHSFSALSTLLARSRMCSQASCTWADSTVREHTAKRSTNLSRRRHGTKWIFLALFILCKRVSFNWLEPFSRKQTNPRMTSVQISKRGSWRTRDSNSWDSFTCFRM